MKLRSILLAALLLAAHNMGLRAQKYAGGDISLLPSYESHGAAFLDHEGHTIAQPLQFFHQQGWNAMRVRLFVNPANASSADRGQGVVQDVAYILPLAKRIKEAGMALLLDFHYSDSWADPGKQWTPKEWQGLNDSQLANQLRLYTTDVLNRLKAAGATPDFIQTGNEISYGMLWGASEASAQRCYPNSPALHWNRLALLLKAATEACRTACPQAQLILHTERVSGNTKLQKDNASYASLTGFYDRMKTYGIDYDIIGLSYYPYFHGALSELEGALNSLKAKGYGKQVMVVETGYPAQYAVPGTQYDYTATYPYTDDGQKAFTDALVQLLNRHGEVRGLFWWFPEANEHGLNWSTQRVTDSWYNASLFNNSTGRATKAVASLKDFINNTTNIHSTTSTTTSNDAWYTLSGIRLSQPPTAKGVYIHKGHKIVRFR